MYLTSEPQIAHKSKPTQSPPRQKKSQQPNISKKIPIFGTQAKKITKILQNNIKS